MEQLIQKRSKRATDNAVIGNAEEVANQIRDRFNPEDRIMCWFDFFNHDSERVIRNMVAFMEKVKPRIEETKMTDQDRPSSVSPGRPGSRIYPSNPLGEKHEGIPTGRDVEWEPLVDFRRLDVSENTIHGAISWVHGDEVIHSFGGNVLVYGRSMMKPLLMKIFTDVLDDELTDKQKAIACSSHNGDTEHVATAQSILTESEWGLMQCPLDVPLVQFGRQVRRPRRWFHTCSGEHAALLRALRLKGINRAGYTLPTSSWFQRFY